MAEITINDVKYTNVPNKKAGTKFASALTQSNIGVSQSVADYMNSAYFYTLVNAVDINWNGIEVAANSYINTTSDLIKFILSVSNNVDLSDYATMSYVNEKISDVIGAAPETLDTLEELAYALSYNASLSYVQEALSGKANVNDVYTKTEVDNLIPAPVDLSSYATTSYMTTELDKKADKTDIVQADMCETDTTSKSYVLNNPYQYHVKSVYGTDYNCYNLVIPHNAKQQFFSDFVLSTLVIGDDHYINASYGIIQGKGNRINTICEAAFGKYNECDTSSNSTIFTVGNGTASKKHNAFAIRKNGTIYIADTEAGTPYSLQSRLNSKADANNVYTKTEVDNLIPESADLSNYVSYTQANSYYMTVEGTKQVINSVKTFVGNKLINFRQSTSSDKLGFTLYNDNEKELGGFEWRPNTIGTKGLLSLQQYLGTGTKYTDVEMGYLGFRLTEVSSKYHLITPLPSYVNTIETINVGNDYRNFFFPLVFKNGNNKVYTECTGLVDLSSLMPSAPDLSGYVSYTQANSYYAAKNDIPTMPDMSSYVSITSYNALAARVEELASWIASYHSSYTPTPSGSDPDIYFMNPTMTVDYTMSASMVDGGAMAYPQYLSGSNSSDGAWITWSSSDTAVATVAHGGCITAQGNGTTNISAEYTAHDTYNYKKVEYSLTISNYNSSIEPVDNSFYFMDSNRTLYNSGMDSLSIINNTGIDTMTYPIQWSSSNANITVDQYGVVSWTMTGETSTITATLSDGTNTYTATCTVTTAVNKTSPTGNWYENGNSVYQLVLVEGAIDAHTLTFTGNPSDSWTFSGTLPSGISVDSSTGEITVSALSSATVGDYYITGNRIEDSTYWSGMVSFTIKVLPSGSNPQFYYEQQSVYLDNSAMQTQSPMIHNEYAGMGYDVTYSSADTSVATVDAYGMISFAGAGNTTVTATLSNGGNTIATATISVYCTSMSA